MRHILVALVIVFSANTAQACEIADVCNAGCGPREYFNTFSCSCVVGKDPYGCENQTETSTKNNCNGMSALNSTCAFGTQWDDATCACKSYCEEGYFFDPKTRACTPDK